MSYQTRIVTGIVCATLGFGTAASAAGDREQVAPADERAVIVEFGRRVRAYVELHRRIEGPVPTIAQSSDPREIRKAIDKLGDAIRVERARAQQGDIFTPGIAAILRRAIRESCRGDFRALLVMVHEDEAPLPHAVVNAKWPGETFPFMPPRLLLTLPWLPEELEYLFLNRDLVLWDWHADLIVDVVPNAIPHET